MYDLVRGQEVFFGVALFWFGALFGSFANVIILRLPRGESVVTPRSRCQSCQALVAWYDNIPIVSFFVLRGKCRQCRASFSWRYPLVEFLMAVLFTAVYIAVGWNWLLVEYLVFVFGLVTVTFIDFDHMILPDSFTLTGIILGLLGGALNPLRSFFPSLYGVLLGGGFLWLVAWVYYVWRKEEGMGGGDIKLLAWIGAVLGWASIPYVILVSSLIGSFVGIVLATVQRSGLKTAIPFGPYLSLAALTYLLGGHEIANWYLRLFFPWL